jgi:nucleotide-binding universal stress UspA family protein
MILVSYDGSADAQAAIDRVAQLMPGAEAMVLTVWEPFIDTLARTGSLGIGLGMAGSYPDGEDIDAASREAALTTAAEGAKRATAAGLVAEPRSVSRHGGIANTILAAASEEDADIIVMGTRGLGGVKSFLLGSVSHNVAQHADRAVLVVPAPALAERRRDWVDHEAPPA